MEQGRTCHWVEIERGFAAVDVGTALCWDAVHWVAVQPVGAVKTSAAAVVAGARYLRFSNHWTQDIQVGLSLKWLDLILTGHSV